MSLDVSFVYYRNFRFDGKFHVRCNGTGLSKVKRIRYELEKAGPQGPVKLDAVSVNSEQYSGKSTDHGCAATLRAELAPGTYTIRPQVMVMDTVTDLPVDQSHSLAMPPLVIVINEGELNRSILDTIDLPSDHNRKRRSLADSIQPASVEEADSQSQQALPQVEEGGTYPLLLIKFNEGGLQRFLADLEPGSGSALVRQWPDLKQTLEPRPLLELEERGEEKLQALRDYCYLQQPASMLNQTYAALLGALATLEYVDSLQFLTAPLESPNLLAAGVAAVLATLITGASVVAGNKAFEASQPTPDFTAQQTYLDEPGPRYKGLNIRKVWEQQVTGKGVRVHFSDGGLFPNHEDLRGNPKLKIISLQPNGDPGHGTKSVGILLARPNDFGMTGMCHDAELYLYNNQLRDDALRIQTPKDLLRHVEPGDIVAINRQSANINVLTTVLPSLHELDWWSAAKALSERGAVVIFAAGNGSSQSDAAQSTTRGYGVDLSQWPYFEDFGDANAIVIGACHSWDGKPHQYSNYSYRYRMLNAWGDSVATLGGGGLHKGDSDSQDRDYTDTYAGTSSATPLVAGALSLIQSYALEQHHIYLNADQMHLLVMQSGYKDATLPDTEVLPMGARPNVQGALVVLDQILGGGKFYTPRDEF